MSGRRNFQPRAVCGLVGGASLCGPVPDSRRTAARSSARGRDAPASPGKERPVRKAMPDVAGLQQFAALVLGTGAAAGCGGHTHRSSGLCGRRCEWKRRRHGCWSARKQRSARPCTTARCSRSTTGSLPLFPTGAIIGGKGTGNLVEGTGRRNKPGAHGPRRQRRTGLGTVLSHVARGRRSFVSDAVHRRAPH